MRIGTVARLTGVSERLLRYYEQRGLLRPTRSANGYREYGEADIRVVRGIRWLLDVGMPTTVIARLADCLREGTEPLVAECPEMARQLRRQRRHLAEHIKTLQGSLDLVETALAIDAGRTGTTGASLSGPTPQTTP
jgi:DNA-binding transcriptional MerR regulator